MLKEEIMKKLAAIDEKDFNPEIEEGQEEALRRFDEELVYRT